MATVERELCTHHPTNQRMVVVSLAQESYAVPDGLRRE